jgi:hypothetical protein
MMSCMSSSLEIDRLPAPGTPSALLRLRQHESARMGSVFGQIRELITIDNIPERCVRPAETIALMPCRDSGKNHKNRHLTSELLNLLPRDPTRPRPSATREVSRMATPRMLQFTPRLRFEAIANYFRIPSSSYALPPSRSPKPIRRTARFRPKMRLDRLTGGRLNL